MLEVVPGHEFAHPLASRIQRQEALGWVARTVLQGAEEGLDLGVVVADTRAAERRGNAQFLARRQHRGPLHRATVIRMQDQRLETPLLGQTCLVQHLGRAGRVLLGEDFPANHLA